MASRFLVRAAIVFSLDDRLMTSPPFFFFIS